MGRGRQAYEVRIRVQTGPNAWMKKSKFYNANSPGDAAKMYKGPGSIMHVEKVKKEKLLGGVGEFFGLGNALLKEFAEERTLASLQKSEEKLRVKKRRGFFAREKQKIQ